ncbi:MAG: HEAT repeat domain-containing protein [Archangium sp.]|nr:HEAT repeat domain-containing protein [Archangium sp.]
MSVSAATVYGYRERASFPWSRTETPVETPAVGLADEDAPRAEELCENHFIELATTNPALLVDWMRTVLAKRPELLTFAAEAAGRIAHTPLVFSALLPLLRHSEAVVREGAVYGLGPHLASSLDARDTLRELLGSESSPGVARAIQEALSLVE